ncbi:MAG: spore photoproduct lyase [Clostridia bacterium]|jgi:spore photoproduct lyase|nr:spore photoproduct lyase [Clostridia bacterium]
MFKPTAIYFEKNIENYTLGKELLEKYKDVPKIEIENHNNIEEMRKKQNSEFLQMKRNLIIGTRKTHKFVENHKVSDYLVPYTSSGCTASCMYCYLVCNYNKCAYLRLFVNREQMLDKIIKTAEKSQKELVFEIGSNSDLILENTITNNLVWTIENFKNVEKGKLTFPTKFSYVDDLLSLEHQQKIIIRMSVNPEYIINNVEFGTSRLKNRVEAINKLVDADYKVGILIAPVIFVENWEKIYHELIIYLRENLSEKAKKETFFEVIFMTYSYVHNAINQEAFINSIEIYDKEKMTGRGKGKYMYKNELRQEGEKFFREELGKYFKSNKIWYIV